jgi:hypothetical protein
MTGEVASLPSGEPFDPKPVLADCRHSTQKPGLPSLSSHRLAAGAIEHCFCVSGGVGVDAIKGRRIPLIQNTACVLPRCRRADLTAEQDRIEALLVAVRA